MTLSTQEIERLTLFAKRAQAGRRPFGEYLQMAALLPALLSERTDLETEVERLKADVTELMGACRRCWATLQVAEAENARLRAGVLEIELRGEHTLNRNEGDAPSRATISAMCGTACALLHEGEK